MKIHDKKNKSGKLEMREVLVEELNDKKFFRIRRTQNKEVELSIGTHQKGQRKTSS